MENNEDKIVMDILKHLVDDLYSYINSEEFSDQILKGEPNLSTFSKTRIEGEIQSRMAELSQHGLIQTYLKLLIPYFIKLFREMLIVMRR